MKKRKRLKEGKKEGEEERQKEERMNSVVLKELRKFQCFKKHRKRRANNIRKSKFFDGTFCKKEKKTKREEVYKYSNSFTAPFLRRGDIFGSYEMYKQKIKMSCS